MLPQQLQAQNVQLTVTAYSATGSPSAVVGGLTLPTLPGSAANNAAYTIKIEGFPIPHKEGVTAGTSITRSIWANGPQFDSRLAARILLDTMRRYAWRNDAVNKNLQAHPQSFARQLLLVRGARPFGKWKRQGSTEEQAIAKGFIEAVSAQLASEYTKHVLSGAGLTEQPVTTQHRVRRQEYTISSNSDFPRYLKPGAVVKFPFQQLNWLKYAPTVESQGFVREYAQDKEFASSSGAKTDSAKNDKAAHGILPSESLTVREQKLEVAIADFKELVAELEHTYRADYWPSVQEDLETRTKLVEKVFGVSFVSARQFTEKPQTLQQQASTLLKEADAAIAKGKPKQAVEEAQSVKTRLTPILDYLKPYTTATDEQKRLATLGDALVQLRTATRPRVPTVLLLPDDKDEADVTITYKIRSEYQSPSGVTLTPLAAQKFTILLLPRFRITGSIGPYYSGLVDHRFSFLSDSLLTGRTQGTAADTTTRKVYSPRKRIERDNDDEWFSSVGASAFIHFEYRLSPFIGLGTALGIGVQNDGPRLLFGPSVLFGNSQRVALSGGVATGRVTRLARGYAEGHENAIKDPGTSQVPTRVVNAASWFVGLSYNLSSSRK
ncbi:hypothetical protein B0919_13735 [Hymenobacter sp. CRA2]|nr:hypothetical protein B0919_13735 [Hymenobacter sp. CRA2]